MPVVPEPPEEEMPRIEIELLPVPAASIVTPGVKRATSVKSLMPFWSMVSWVNALTLTGTLLSAASCRVAVMTISCKGPAGETAGPGALAGDAAATGAAAAGAAGGCSTGAAAGCSAGAAAAGLASVAGSVV